MNPVVLNTVGKDEGSARLQKIVTWVVFGAVLSMIALSVLAIVCPAFANVDNSYAGTMQNIIDQLLDILGNIGRAVGIILLAFSVFQLIMAIKDENPDGQSRAAKIMAVAAFLCCLPWIFNALTSAGLFSMTSTS